MLKMNISNALDAVKISLFRHILLVVFALCCFCCPLTKCLFSGQQHFSCHSLLVLVDSHKEKFEAVKTFCKGATFIRAAAQLSVGLWRRIWLYLSWSLGEPERALRLFTPDSAVREIRKRWFCWVKKNDALIFSRTAKKTTENKCQKEWEEDDEKAVWAVYKWLCTVMHLHFKKDENLLQDECLEKYIWKGQKYEFWLTVLLNTC